MAGSEERRRQQGLVLITGGSEGLGLALAEGFAVAGWGVSVCGRSAGKLRTAEAKLAASGASFLVSQVDVTSVDAVRAWVERTERELGPVAGLVNNASILGERNPLTGLDVDEWRRVLEVNLTGCLIATQAVVPGMIARGGGWITNVSSGASIPPRVNWGAYAVSKAGVDALSLNLAAELKGTGVRVNVVDPGPMRTAMRAAAYPDEDPLTIRTASAIVPVFLWLANGDGSTLTGERISAASWLQARRGDGGERDDSAAIGR